MGFWREISYCLVIILVGHWVLAQVGTEEQRGDKDQRMDE